MRTTRIIIPANTQETVIHALRKAIAEARPEHLGYIGIIGSANTTHPAHDIDVLTFPKPRATLSAAHEDLERLYQTLDTILETDAQLTTAPFPLHVLQETRTYLIEQTKGRQGLIPLHVLFFPDKSSYETILNPWGFATHVRNNNTPLLGTLDVLEELEDIPQRKLDPFYVIEALQPALTQDKLPPTLFLRDAEHALGYLRTHYLPSIPEDLPRTPAEATNMLIHARRMLDTVTPTHT